MKHLYKISKSSPPRWTRLWRSVLMVCMLIPITQQGWAAWSYQISTSKITCRDYRTQGGYIEMTMPVYRAAREGSALYRNEGFISAAFKVMLNDETSSTTIFNFKTFGANNSDSRGDGKDDGNYQSFDIAKGTRAWIKAWLSEQASTVGHVRIAKAYYLDSNTTLQLYPNSYYDLSYFTDGGSSTAADQVWMNHADVTDNPGDPVYYETFRWYPSDKYMSGTLKVYFEGIRYYQGAAGNSQDVQTDKMNTQNNSTSMTGSVSYPAPSLSPSLSQTANNFSVTYGVSSQPIVGSMYSWDNSSWTTTTESERGMSGSKDIAISNKKNTFKFFFKYRLHAEYDDLFAAREATIDLPPYRQASGATSILIANGNSKITWKIENTDTSGDYYTSDDYFEVQRCSKSDFSSDVTTLDEIPFKNNQTSYEVGDSTGIDNLNGTIYYRIRRKSAAVWSWVGAYSFSTNISMTHQGIKEGSVTASMNTDNSGITIKWKLEDVTSNSIVWSSGSQVNIVRTDNVSAKDVYIPIEDKSVTSYVDKDLTTCREYTYSVMVRPGSNKYTDTKKIQAVTNGKLIPSVLAKIKSVTASKGYFSEYTRVTWTTDGNPTDQFIVERRVVGSSDTTYQIAGTVTGSYYMYDDEKSNAGTIYEYRVKAYTNCNNQDLTNISPMSDRGFRNPTGSLTGQILFEYGDAVANVDVRMNQSSEGQTQSGSTLSGYSYKFSGNTDSYLETDSMIAIPDYASLQAFVKPTKDGQTASILSWGRYQLRLNNGKVAFSANNSTKEAVSPNTLPTDRFSQLTVTHSSDSLRIYIDSIKVASLATAGNIGAKSATKITMGKGFTGYIDEVRIWNRALSSYNSAGKNEIVQTYNRLLSANENGLYGYWRFNEPVSDAFYDISYSGETYNAHHGKVYNAVHSNGTDETPTERQLSLRGLTDETGYYYITGIPYVGSGSMYTITPSYENHSFSPKQQVATISSQQPNYSKADFKDISSFTIDGYVFYENSTIPVKDATFEIGGSPVTSNGDYIRSDDKGYFKFSVPAGEQTVRVLKDNHTFANKGLLQNDNGLNFNYQTSMSNLRFWDQTKVKLIGRVAGGTKQDSYPLGFSLSKNNLGDNTTIVMTLEGDNSSYIVNRDTPYDSTMTHYDGTHKNTVRYAKTQISISPDNETGEYVALLYPVKYKITQISAKGYDNLFPTGTNAVVLDLSNKFTEQTSNYTDEKNVKHSITYNEKFNRIFRNNTSLTFKQYRYGRELDYYGDLNYMAEKLVGVQNISLYNTTTKQYLFGYPVFHSTLYKMKVSAHEDYYYNNVKSGSNVKVDAVNLNGGTVKVSNGFNTQKVSSEIELDSLGTAIVDIDVDNVPFSLSGTNALRSLDMSMTVDGQNVQAPQLQAYLTGARSQGKDYVTGGPVDLMYILRDPPGSNSYSYLEKGVSTSYDYSASTGVANEGDMSFLAAFGCSQIHGIVVPGGATLTSMDLDNNVGAVVHNEESGSWGNSSSYSLTTTTRFQTSDDPAYVGADGDVFVGTTSNISYGPADHVGIIAKDMYDAAKNTQSGTTLSIIDQTADGQYYLVNNIALALNKRFATMFAYPQKHIEEVLIPNLKKVRNSFLLTGITEAEAQDRANATNKWVYLSLLDSTDTDYGKDNLNAAGNYIGVEKYGVDSLKQYLHYKIFEPNKAVVEGDSVYTLNQSIKEWERVLKQNEEEKLLSTDKLKNYSFHAGSPIEYAESYSYSNASTYNFDLYIAAGVSTELGFKIANHGFAMSIQETVGATHSVETSTGSGEDRTSGFVLADEGTDDYLSVDVYRTNAVGDSTFYNKFYNDSTRTKIKNMYGNFIFRTRGGATSCPYEGERVTKYYNKGTKLDEATQQIEKPVLMVDNPVISNIPSNETAKFNLKLYSESETKAAGVYTLALVDWQNQHGAKFSIDGVPLSDGRSIEIPFGDVLNKVLEVGRGTEYDYDNLALVLRSQCDDNITDTVYLSAHFIPSSSDINIKSPTDKWTLNTNSPLDSITGKYYMPITIDGYDVNFTGFDHIELQYKASSESDSKWTTISSFYNDTAKFNAASGEKAMITGATISSRFFGAEDQKYDLRAVSFSKLGNDFVTKTSTLASGMKDTKRPVVFGNVQPADGVLDVEDELKVTFNEEIAEGVMTNVKNFEVTGIRNGTNTDHSTSLTFDGKAAYLATQAERNLSDKSFTVEMWVLPSSLGQKMTLFSHGTTDNALELSIGANKSIQVQVGDKTYSSLPQDFKITDWTHVALTYNAANQQVSAYFNDDPVINNVTAGKYTGTGVITFGRGINGSNFFAGKMHEARVWNKVVSEANLIANKLTIYTGQELGMMDYYPMNEGKGTTVTDKAQGATAWINGAIWSTLDGMSLALDGKSVAKVNASRIAVTDEMNYTLAFWFKADAGQTNAALVSNGIANGSDFNSSYNKIFIGFKNGKLIFRNNKLEKEVDGSYLDNNWHHFAIAVNRNAGNAQIFIDGGLKTYFDASTLGGISAASLNLGACNWIDSSTSKESTDSYLKGQIDELQLWNMALPSKYIADKYNVCPKGKEIGLMAYLPFSKYITNKANAQELVYSGEDVVTDSTLVTLTGATSSMEKAPVRAKGPEVSIPFNFVVNKDALVINLTDTPEAIEKTTVNITVKDVVDLNGNLMLSPVTWSAYINQNQLKWSESSVAKEKKAFTAMSFDVDVKNIGGAEKNFTIEGLPSWLKASPMSGTLDPLGKQTITFTVNEGTSVGSYDQVVYVKGENNVAEALPITLKVYDEKPDWTVDASKYAYSMNLYGKIRINSQFSSDAEDRLAAFDGAGNCIGVANNQYVEANDMWYVLMTIYNNTNNTNDITFRVWDASSGLVYDAVPNESITFINNTVKGTADSPIIFDTQSGQAQRISLITGWNWVSFNVASSLLSTPATLLKSLTLKGNEQIKDESNSTFAAYNAATSTWIGNNVQFDNKHMFLIQSSSNQTLNVAGTALQGTSNLTLDIAKGWNYISYLPSSSLSVKEAMAGYSVKAGDLIKSQDAFSMYGEKTGWLGNLNYMQPGKGYMLYSSDGGKLVYPDLTAAGTKAITRADGVSDKNVWKELRNETNMSMVATVADNLPLQPGDKLLAYANNELCGAAQLSDNPVNGTPLYFITVGGDTNASVSFALEREGQVIGRTSPLFDYRSNAVRGSIEQPIILDFVNNIGISVYPNPFEGELNFDMNVNQGDKINITLYSLTGRLLYNYEATAATSGYWHYRWQCTDNIVSTLYMAVVSINGEKHVYKVRRK